MHLDLETCAALKAAGMPWEPKDGDFIYYHSPNGCSLGVISGSDMVEHKEESLDNIYTGEWFFCPRLDDLLALIEAEEWNWGILKDYVGYFVYLGNHEYDSQYEDTPESAAAAAVIWILQTKNKEG